MNALSWKNYKTVPCQHGHAHIWMYGRYVCMGCASPNYRYEFAEKIRITTTMGITHAKKTPSQPDTG